MIRTNEEMEAVEAEIDRLCDQEDEIFESMEADQHTPEEISNAVAIHEEKIEKLLDEVEEYWMSVN